MDEQEGRVREKLPGKDLELVRDPDIVLIR